MKLARLIPMAGKASNGKACLKIVGKLRFEGNQRIKDEDFDTFYHEHCVRREDFDKFKSSWTAYKGEVVAWKFALLEAFDVPWWIPHNQDRPFSAFNSRKHYSLVVNWSIWCRVTVSSQ